MKRINYLLYLLFCKIFNFTITKEYPGFNCGCCGRWWNIPFKVTHYRCNLFTKLDENWETWGLCPKDKGCWLIKKEKK